MFDDNDDLRRAEAEADADHRAASAEAWDAAVDCATEDDLRENDPWYARARRVIDEVHMDRGRWTVELVKLIEARAKKLFEELRPEVADAMLDEAAYAEDPYKYHGVSRSDFI